MTSLHFQLSAIVLPIAVIFAYGTLLAAHAMISLWYIHDFDKFASAIPYLVGLGIATYCFAIIEIDLIKHGIRKCRNVPELTLNIVILMCGLGYGAGLLASL